MINFTAEEFEAARQSPFYFSRTDISDDDKMAMLKANLDERMGEIERGEFQPIDEAYLELKHEFSLKRLKIA